MGKKTEGWITGLRLVALSIHQREDLERILANLPDNNRYVMAYLVEEVLSQQPLAIQEYLLATSILDRFCAPLCDVICASRTSSEPSEIQGEEFIEWIEKGNLFVVALDEEHRWVHSPISGFGSAHV